MPDKNICTTAALAGIEKGPVPKEEDQSPKINTNTVYHENEEMSNKEE